MPARVILDSQRTRGASTAGLPLQRSGAKRWWGEKSIARGPTPNACMRSSNRSAVGLAMLARECKRMYSHLITFAVAVRARTPALNVASRACTGARIHGLMQVCACRKRRSA
eukprot:1090643-Pleurochrysis_carterae.AAC.2